MTYLETRITTRFTPDQIEFIDSMAKKLRMTRSSVLRGLLDYLKDKMETEG